MGMKYIEVEQAIKTMMQFPFYDEEGASINDADEKESLVRDWIECVPLADVQEVKHGKWICHISDIFPAESTMECSLCHNERDLGYADKYCPNCGAKMDGGAE